MSESEGALPKQKSKSLGKRVLHFKDIDALLEDIEEKRLLPPKMVPCELCGADTPDGNRFCHACFWKAKWPPHIAMAPENASRRKRSHLTKLIALDPYEPLAAFRGSKGNAYIYLTNIRECTCVDFGLGHGGRPCKHIYRLANELGLLTAEKFSEEEDDYILHISEPTPQEIEMQKMLHEAKSLWERIGGDS